MQQYQDFFFQRRTTAGFVRNTYIKFLLLRAMGCSQYPVLADDRAAAKIRIVHHKRYLVGVIIDEGLLSPHDSIIVYHGLLEELFQSWEIGEI